MKSLMGKTKEILNKLLRINNDRVEYYPRSSAKTNDLNLNPSELAQQGIRSTISGW
jgi:hypothetical protein